MAVIERFGRRVLALATIVLPLILSSASCSSKEKKNSFCGPGAGPASAAGAVSPTKTGPRRLGVADQRLLDEAGNAIVLRGVNVRAVDDRDAADIADNLHLNFVRLRIDFEPDTRDDNDTTSLTASYRAEIDGWVQALVAKRIWFVIEMRSNDELTNGTELYDPSTETFAKYRAAWRYLASHYKDTDYVAGYGLLAEPSASRSDPAPVGILTRFQRALMDDITTQVHDTVTPFFVGSDFNYDTMQYRYDDYYDKLADYRGRLIYEVNTLLPKPWIDNGAVPEGVASELGSWPQPAPPSFDFLLVPAPNEDLAVPRDYERIFNKRRVEPQNFGKLLNKEFLRWYLHFAFDFATRHRVPMIVDQFGASFAAKGQLAYETDVVDVAEGYGFSWARWSYNAGTQDRYLAADESVCEHYRQVARAAVR